MHRNVAVTEMKAYVGDEKKKEKCTTRTWSSERIIENIER